MSAEGLKSTFCFSGLFLEALSASGRSGSKFQMGNLHGWLRNLRYWQAVPNVRAAKVPQSVWQRVFQEEQT